MFDNILVAAIFLSTMLATLTGVAMAMFEFLQLHHRKPWSVIGEGGTNDAAFVARQFANADLDQPLVNIDNHAQHNSSAHTRG